MLENDPFWICGVNFQYYTEPMKAAHKVALICSQTNLLQFPFPIPYGRPAMNHLYCQTQNFRSIGVFFSPLTC